MPSVDELTRIADRLRTRRPNQAERGSIADLLDRWANDLAPPTPKPAKPKSIEEAVRQLDEPPVEVRKIANGVIVRETTNGPRSFKTKETFTAEKPQIAISKA